ncbi:MAG TPA: hypothetical protein VFM77_19325 [Terriglobales bacterium]|nr:hypothetical protein [Terriglobales bacterium]
MKSSRRDFLQISGLSLGALGLPSLSSAKTFEGVSLSVDPSDPVASSAPCRWAASELSQALSRHGVKLGHYSSFDQAPRNSLCIVAFSDQNRAKQLMKDAGAPLPDGPESLALLPISRQNKRGMLAFGDTRGLTYGLLELADRVCHSDQPLLALEQHDSTIERPFNAVRSNGRIFCSDIQDKPWFNDREMWSEYFSMLATQRFNRFSLNLGIGYDFLDDVSDAYFLFTYPFLLAVPGYNVRAVNLSDQERDRNLEMLQFISSQAVAHGIDFQLGIWTHGYKWGPASKPNYTIEGITPENHASYSRDALTALLKACPDISGITLRTHGESGVREGSYEFWSTVFSALPASGRKVRLGLHTKGLNQELIDAALKTEMPVTLEPKYWAEHMGLSYQQAAIRDLEMPHEERSANGFFSLSSGSRSFTRYGYADFLRDDRQYEVVFRIWPGSHRLLLWGDPVSAAAHARAFNFCGCNGVELFEPLSFKGRRGSGIAGSRCAYADKTLEPRWDWEKYLYTYRTWGRLMYNPGASPDVWQRYLQKQFGAAARSMESALSSATPITEIITTAHLPSAANEGFSPEYYTNQSIVDASKPSPYSDTPSPKVFGNVSPLDPQLFSSISEFVGKALKREPSGKYSPWTVAQALDSAAENAASHLGDAEAKVRDRNSPDFRRAAVDLRITIGIGHFFAAKFRSGVFYAAYEQSGNPFAINGALKHYRRAAEVWLSFAAEARGSYVLDITFGTAPHQRGNWLDRLDAIDEDVAEMQRKLDSAPANSNSDSLFDLTPRINGPEILQLLHTPASSFTPGQPFEITIRAQKKVTLTNIRLYYRHVNQAEPYQHTDMVTSGDTLSFVLPADYTNSKYPLEYYFEAREGVNWVRLFPGLWNKLQTEPYFVVPGRISDK